MKNMTDNMMNYEIQRINRDKLPINIALNKNYDGRKHNKKDFN